MLVFKEDENFKVSVRHYFHNASSFVETRCVTALLSALDDDVNGAKQWEVLENGQRRKVLDEDGEQVRTERAVDDETVKVLEMLVKPEEIFADELAKAVKYAEMSQREESAETYRRRLARVETEIKALYYDCARKMNDLAQRMRAELGDEVVPTLATFQTAVVAIPALIDTMTATDFVAESSEKRTERLQDLLETDRLPEYVGGLAQASPTFNGLKAEVRGTRCEDAFNAMINQPEILVEMRDEESVNDHVENAVNAVCEVVATDLQRELSELALKMLEPNADLDRLVDDTVPKVVTRTVFAENKNFGLIRHIRERLFELLEDIA